MYFKMNLADPELEFIDPTPNVHALFVQFDNRFFWGKLASRAVVRWSKKMYSCAGICRYEGHGGLCDVALSEPLLKLRPRKDLIETLLHEMIHAYLFIVGGDRDRDGHGPTFQSHMFRINKEAGLNISIYHSFHDEVRLYQTHWWRCNGPCQHTKPFFGIVRRSYNRAPGPHDSWWARHQQTCGGTFIKIKEPEKNKNKKAVSQKTQGNITKFFNNTSSIKTLDQVSHTNSGTLNSTVRTKNTKNVKTLSDLQNKTQGFSTKTNGGGTVTISKKNLNNTLQTVSSSGSKNKNVNPIHSADSENIADHVRNIWTNKKVGNIQAVNGSKKRSSEDVADYVRNVWANKQIGDTKAGNSSNSKRNPEITYTSPPHKIKKLDEPSNPSTNYKKPFDDIKTSSLLKDIYGEDFTVYEKKDNQSSKIAVTHSNDLEIVACPLCNIKVKHADVNTHVDECLNRSEIHRIHLEEKVPIKEIQQSPSTSEVIDLTWTDISLTSKEVVNKKCPCCDKMISGSMEEHLEECLSFFNNNNTAPDKTTNVQVKPEQDSTDSLFEDHDSFVDELDESGIFNDTGTKYPCPCCFQIFEGSEMNQHLDVCLEK